MDERVRKQLNNNIFFVLVAVISAVYMARGFVTIFETGKTIWEILADGAIGALFGFLVSKLLSLQGIAKGEINEQVQATTRLHADVVESVVPVIDKLDAWCESKNEEAVKMARSRILAAQGLQYSDYLMDMYTIVEEGKTRAVAYRNLPRAKRRAVRRARRLRLTPLTAGALTSDCNRPFDPYDFGMDKHVYQRRRDLSQVVSKVCCGLLFGYFGVRLITDFSWEGLIWMALQVTAFLAMGAVSYLRAYFFVVDYDRHRIIRKIDNLQKFKVWSEQHEKESSDMDKVVSCQHGAAME